MKRIFYSILAVATISSAFTACQKEQPSAEPATPAVEAKPFYVTVDNPFPDTKATFTDGVGMSWEKDDWYKLRMVVTSDDTGETGNVYKSTGLEIDANTGAATFTFDAAPAAGSTVSFLYGPDGYKDLGLIFEPEQSQPALGNLGANRLCLKAVNVKVEGTTAAPKMELVGNIRRFLIYSSTGKYVAEKVSSIEMTSTINWLTLAGRIGYDYLGQSNEEVVEYHSDTVKVSVSTPQEVTAKTPDDTKSRGIYMTVPPLSSDDAGVIYVITTDKAKYYLYSDKLNFEKGNVTNLPINLESKFITRRELNSNDKFLYFKGDFPNLTISAGVPADESYGLGYYIAVLDGSEVKYDDAHAAFYSPENVKFEFTDSEGKEVTWITECFYEKESCWWKLRYEANNTGKERTAVVTAIFNIPGYIAMPAAKSVTVTQPAQTTTPQQ